MFRRRHVHSSECFHYVLRAQERKAPVTYCDHMLSVVCLSLRRLLDNLHFQLLLENRLMNFDETWYGWSTQGPLQVLLFLGQIRPGADPGQCNKRSRGSPSQRTSSSDQKATGTNQMHSSDLEACGKKCCYTPRNEVRGCILESPCPSVCLSVCLSGCIWVSGA